MRCWGSLSANYRSHLATSRARHEFDRLIALEALPASSAPPDVVADHLRSMPRDTVDAAIGGLSRVLSEPTVASTAFALLWFALEPDLASTFTGRLSKLGDEACDLEAHIALALFTVARDLGSRATRRDLLDQIATALRGDGNGWRRKHWMERHGDAADAVVEGDDLPTRILVRHVVGTLPEKERDALLRVIVAGHTIQDAARAHGVWPNALRNRLARSRARLRPRFLARGLSR